MKWIVVAIIACIVPYTWITLAYRKEGPAYEPYQDSKDRAQVMRLLDAGFQRVSLSLERLVEPPPPASPPASSAALPGRVPPPPSDILLDQPALPASFLHVDAAASALEGAPYSIVFTCVQPAQNEQPVSSKLYLREQEAVFIVGSDALPGTLEARDLDSLVRLVVPANTFQPGTYQATLLGTRESRRWTFVVH